MKYVRTMNPFFTTFLEQHRLSSFPGSRSGGQEILPLFVIFSKIALHWILSWATQLPVFAQYSYEITSNIVLVTASVSPKYSAPSCQDFGWNVVKFILISRRICSSGAFAKLRKTSLSFVLSVCPHCTIRLHLDVFSWNFIFECFPKICRGNLSFIKMWQEWVLYMKTYVLMIVSRWILLRMRNVSAKLQRKSNKGFIFNKFFPPANLSSCEIMWKIWYSRTGHRWQ